MSIFTQKLKMYALSADETNYLALKGLTILSRKHFSVVSLEVSGNNKTTDSVVRRELRQFEAERFSASGVKRSKERLERTRLYKDVRVNLAKTDEENHVRMNVEIEEEKTMTEEKTKTGFESWVSIF